MASLWKVPDEETKALMGAFYTNLWQKKLSPLESLRQAQLAMLRSYDPQAGRLRAPDFSQAARAADDDRNVETGPRRAGALAAACTGPPLCSAATGDEELHAVSCEIRET